MPLYTYIAHYQGRTKVEQTRVSNYRGFAAGQLARMADRGLLGTSRSLKNEMVGKAYRAPWSPVAELSSVWRTAFELNGDQLELYAVQTKD